MKGFNAMLSSLNLSQRQWDVRLDDIILPGLEMRKLASLTTDPALWQQLHTAYQTPGNHPLLNWLMVTFCTVRPNQGDLLSSPTRWPMYVELQHVLWELGMKTAIYNP